MRGMCVWLREISPGEREMASSGGKKGKDNVLADALSRSFDFL